MERVFREILVHKQLRHRHICRLLEVVDLEDTIYMVLEYCPGGELFTLVERQSKLDESQARHIFGQLLSAIMYCHSQKVVHRGIP